MEKYVSITADDYGPHPFVNAGILKAIEADKIDSVNVLVNKYSAANSNYEYNFSEAIQNLVETIGDKQVGIGAHITISSGKPLVPSKFLFLESGQFQNIKSFDFGTGRSHLQAINAELEAQILTLKSELEKYNKTLDHISSHHGLVSLFTPYNNELINVLLRHDIQTAIRNPLPVSKEKRLKKWFKKSHMKREGFGRAFRLLDDNLNHVGKLLKGVKRKELVKKADHFRMIGCHVPNHFFDNFYGKPSEGEMNRVFKRFQHSIFKDYGELVVHLGAGSNSNIELNGINPDYFSTRLLEANILNQYDFDFLDDGNVFRAPMSGFIEPSEPLIA